MGRVRELAALDAALAAARHGPPLACLLRGESGVGKTALVRHFAEHARDRVGALVLSGRCYQREAVPYKAVDELVDDIVRYLGSLAPDRCRELLPPDVGMLTQLFPVVRRVVPGGPGMARPSTEFGLYEYRTRALAALRALVSALAASQPLVLAVDDLQWSDADSLVLLRALLEPPDAPPVLLLATVRTMDTSPDALGPEALRDALPCEVRELALSRLSDDEARSLVAHLLTSVAPAAGQPGQESSPEASAEIAADAPRTPDPADVDAVVREAGGHPMFLDVLVRHHRVATPGARAVSLEDALWRRVGVLDPGARELVELAAVAGRPIAQAVAIAALGADPEPFDRGVGALAGARLAATTGRRPSDLLDVCHSRVREAVLANLGGGERTRWHRALAAALEASGEADPEFVASHWRAAGDEARAAGFYERAADAARDSLAFERAARLYRTCLELARDADHALLLRVELADALMCAGRGTEAAREYLTAAERAGDADALELTRRGAEQLLRSGRVEEGMAALDRVLRAVGLPPIPRSRRVALAKIAWRRSWLAIRGRRHRRRRADELPPEQLARIDACWVAATSLSLCDPLLGVLFQTYHLSLALRAGEPMRAARAIALDAAYASIPGTERYDRTQALIAEAAALADEVDEPQVRAWVGGARGSLAYLSGHWVEAAEQCAATEQEFRSLPTGTTWEMITLQVFYLSALACLGEFKALQSVLPGYIREADSRDDLYGAVALRIGHVNLAWLAADEPGGARAYVREADTKLPDGEFYIPHYYRLLAQTRIDLYEGRTDEARERLEQAWPLVSRAQMTRVQLLRIYAFHIRACVHLAAAEAALATGAGAARGDTARSLRIADRCAARLLRESAPWSVALGQSVKAALSRLRGERAALEPQLLRAADALDVVALPVHAACLRRARGALLGGGEGSIEIEAADLWLASRGVRAPSLLARALVPGLALPEP